MRTDYTNITKDLIRRDVAGRYKGSVFGALWTLLTPLMMLAVFTLMFGVVVKARWSEGSADQSTSFFALALFCGLIVFNFFSEVVSKAPTLIIANANLVKKVVFPIELLPVVATGAALVQLAISFFVLLLFIWLIVGWIPISAILAPLMIAPLVVTLLGLSWFLAALGVYFRDVNQIIGPVLTAAMFLSPIFVSRSSMPTWLQPWLVVNPMCVPVESLRSVVVFGVQPDWKALGYYSLVAIVAAFLGHQFFQKTRKGFADVL